MPKPLVVLRRQCGSPGYGALEPISGGPYGVEMDKLVLCRPLLRAQRLAAFRGDKVSDILRRTVRARASCSGSHMEQVSSEFRQRRHL